MTRTTALALFAALLCGPFSDAPARDWLIDPEDSRLGFSATAQGERFDGRFQRFEANIRFDPEALDQASFDVHIDLASVDTDNVERDDTLRGGDFFAVRRHPEARYLAESFRALGNDRYAADGTLGLRGIERPTTLLFAWRGEGAGAPGGGAVLEGRALLIGEAGLNRLDFDLGTGDWADAGTIGHRVEVSVRLNLRATE